MDFHLKQWKDQHHESEQQQPPLYFHATSSSMTPQRLLLQPHYHFHQQQQEASSEPALPLFVPEPLSNRSPSILSAYPDSTSPISRLPRMGGYFSLAQMQELELQALIYRHMVAGAAVPPELLHLVEKSLLNNSPYHFLQDYNTYPNYAPNWYWGRAAAMDPEPGRCRRTDGKKWRCSRDVVMGQRYCERHIHRGRNRSRKPVELPTSNTTTNISSTTVGGGSDAGHNAVGGGSDAGHNAVGGLAVGYASAAGLDMFQLNQGLSESRPDRKGLSESQHEASGDENSNNSVLRCFFDDWPRSSDHTENISAMPSSTSVSMSTTRNPSSMDFLRLSTGSNGHEPEGRPPVNWWGGSSNHVASVGGPLAEALRSSTGSSPTSVLHPLQRSSASDTSFVSA